MINGGILTIALLLPNLIWILLPSPTPAINPEGHGSRTLKVMAIFERIGQAGSFIIPFFYNFSVHSVMEAAFLGLLLAAFGLYIACWARYFTHQRRQAWLYHNLGRLPLPMSILPVICFLCAAVVMHSLFLAAAASILGIGHIYMSRYEYSFLPEK